MRLRGDVLFALVHATSAVEAAEALAHAAGWTPIWLTRSAKRAVCVSDDAGNHAILDVRADEQGRLQYSLRCSHGVVARTMGAKDDEIPTFRADVLGLSDVSQYALYVTIVKYMAAGLNPACTMCAQLEEVVDEG